MARASASAWPAKRPSLSLRALMAVSRRPRSAWPTSAKGRSSGTDASGADLSGADLSRFSRSSGKSGSHTEIIRRITPLHGPTFPGRRAPTALEREVPTRRAGRRRIEARRRACHGCDAPAGERSRQARAVMAGEEQAGRARGLGGEAETAGDQGRPHLDLGESGDQCPALQSFFQGPGGVGALRASTRRKRAGSRPRPMRPGP